MIDLDNFKPFQVSLVEPEAYRFMLLGTAAVPKVAGSDLLVAKVIIFITEFSLLGEMSEVYSAQFPHRLTKTTVEISGLDKNGLDRNRCKLG